MPVVAEVILEALEREPSLPAPVTAEFTTGVVGACAWIASGGASPDTGAA